MIETLKTPLIELAEFASARTIPKTTFEVTTHAKLRALERTGHEIVTPEHMRELTTDVSNKTYLACRLDKYGINHIIITRMGGRLVTACVDLSTKTVVTFLPTDMFRWRKLRRFLTPTRYSESMLLLQLYLAGKINKLR